MDIKEIALKIGHSTVPAYWLSNEKPIACSTSNFEKLVSFAEALISSYKAELLKEVGKPVAARRKVAMWQGGDDYKYEWAVVKEHTPGTEPLFTSDQVAAAILKATKPLEEEIDRLESESEEYAQLQSRCFDGGGSHASVFDEVSELRAQLATAEQRVAEACALQVATETRFHWLDAARVAKEIRSGEWRKFVKEM